MSINPEATASTHGECGRSSSRKRWLGFEEGAVVGHIQRVQRQVVNANTLR